MLKVLVSLFAGCLLFSTPAWADSIYVGDIQVSLLKHCKTGFFIKNKVNEQYENSGCLIKLDKENRTVVAHLMSHKIEHEDDFSIIINFIEANFDERELFIARSNPVLKCRPVTSSLNCKIDKSHLYSAVCNFENGDVYKGHLSCDGKFNGYGQFDSFASNETYLGNFKDGMREGKGLIRKNRVTIFEGNWSADKKNGPGVSFESNGKRSGTWENNQLNGLAELKYGNGQVNEERWLKGKLVSERIIKYDPETQKKIEKENLMKQKQKEKEARIAEKQWEKRREQQQQYERIYNNCIVDKLPANADRTLRKAVEASCSDKANYPSFLDKLKYN